MSAAVAYLVAREWEGRWVLGDDWTAEQASLDDARRVAAEWRSFGYRVGVLSVSVVDPATGSQDTPC